MEFKSTNEIKYEILSRFLEITIDNYGCWYRSSNPEKKKYQRITLLGRSLPAHVFSAILFLNYKPKSILNVCHKCDMPACFNPDHLFIGTYLDNMLDYRLKKSNQRVFVPALSKSLDISTKIVDNKIVTVVSSNYDTDSFLEDIKTIFG